MPIAPEADVVGFAPSNTHPGIYWLLWTSPDGSQTLVATTPSDGQWISGIDLGEVVTSATSMSIGPGPIAGSDYLYVADETIELAGRPGFRIVRISEPDPNEITAIEDVAVFPGQLAEGPIDVEAVMVGTSNVTLLTSGARENVMLSAGGGLSETGLTIFKADASLKPNTARPFTSAALAGDGSLVVARSEGSITMWPAESDVAGAMVEPGCTTTVAQRDPNGLVAVAPGGSFYTLEATTEAVISRFDGPSDLATAIATDGTDPIDANLAPETSIARPTSGENWIAGSELELVATGNDDTPFDPSKVRWEAEIKSCPVDGRCTTRTVANLLGSPATLRIGHVGLAGDVTLEVTARYRDSGGLEDESTVSLTPRTSRLSVESQPQGTTVTVGENRLVTPAQIEAIVNDRVQVSVPELQVIDGNVYGFLEWSNEGDRSHELTVDGPMALTALLKPEDGHISFGGNAGTYASRLVNLAGPTSVIDMRVLVSLDDWTVRGHQGLLGARSGRLQLLVRRDGALETQVWLGPDDRAEAISTTRLDPASAVRLWLRVRFDASSGVATFYVSDDRTTDHTEVEWQQLGESVDTGKTGTVGALVRELIVGQANTQTLRPMQGKLFAAAWLADGQLVATIDFTNPAAATATDYSEWGRWKLAGDDWLYVSDS